MRRLPPLHALRAFEAAARHRHFARAAAELNVTATAVSHQVRQLEEILGVPLFHRYPRPIRLTPEGAALFPVLRESFDAVAAAIAGIAPGAEDRPLRCSVTMAFASRWLLPRLPRLRAETGAALDLEADDRPADLGRGAAADFAIRQTARPAPELESLRLFADRLVPVCAPDLLAAEGEVRTAGDLCRWPLIRYRWKMPGRAAPDWDRWFAAAGEDGAAFGIAQSFSEEIHALDAALAGQGAVLASECLVAGDLAAGRLVRLPGPALPGAAFWAVLRPDHPRRAEIARIVAWIAAERGNGGQEEPACEGSAGG